MLLVGPVLSVSSWMSVWVSSKGFLWVSIALFPSPQELVQASAVLLPWMPLGTTSLLLAGTVLFVGYEVSVWVLSVFLVLDLVSTQGGKSTFLEKFALGV